jgi:hypothetical protein
LSGRVHVTVSCPRPNTPAHSSSSNDSHQLSCDKGTQGRSFG